MVSADFGAKASTNGYDVSTVADYLQLFNSSWPHLKIAFSGSATITLNATPQTIVTHGLKYPPLYFIVGFIGGSPTGIFNSTAGESGIGVNDQILAYDGSQSSGSSFTFYYFVCRLDLTSTKTYPNITGGSTQTTTDDNYGIKVTKPGKSTNSTDLRDYSLYSSSRSLMVGLVNNKPMEISGSYFTNQVYHGLPYTPIAFVYSQFGPNTLGLNPDYYYLLPPSIGVGIGFYDVSSVTVSAYIDTLYISSGTPVASSIVLKDPFYKQTISKVYP